MTVHSFPTIPDNSLSDLEELSGRLDIYYAENTETNLVDRTTTHLSSEKISQTGNTSMKQKEYLQTLLNYYQVCGIKGSAQ